ncbi:carboxypeptidase B [Orussus abietinus]|uniref:carboxypeptidase B n=1 Tax=Orussus abietinus TaxID=222816 RepID=UPI000C715F07|nr:carboxypeptidase B [Orussus abietinus]
MYARLLLVVIAAVSLARGIDAENVPSIHGMQYLIVIPDTVEKMSFVQEHERLPGFDFLEIKKRVNSPVKVLVTADHAKSFKSALDAYEIEYTVILDDLNAVRGLLNQDQALKLSLINRPTSKTYSFDFFPRYNQIVQHLKYLAQKHEHVTLIEIGKSYENRSIYGVKISSSATPKPIVLIDAGIHAREWIAPTTALYTITQLAENKTNSNLYKNVDWFIIPSLNPDGYEFSHTDYRMWRKTRSVNNFSSCYGVDANRNFGLKWMTVGASSNPCSDTYAGPKPFSEPETQALRDFALSKKGLVKAYLTLHSYGQYFLHPWGYTSDLPENAPTLRYVAENAAKALKSVSGTHYVIGSSTNVLYAAAGGSDDWAMGVAGADVSYTIELPGGGIFGFNPPPNRILPVGIETFEAIKSIGSYVGTRWGQRY